MSKVYFVGCGPGDPDLITIKAKKLVQKADVIVYSGSLIPSEILKYNKKGKNMMQRNLFVKKFLIYF
uniref:Precorrin-4 C11-methyltransferase (CobM, cbiF) n=1 Tax=uncultured marine thaumarchaeote AD1000_96_F07 TaxID=1455948 RepID=A0A075G689_9ARCH|nr:Precorrin-4 C11-methyltransferase (cobM, cbiF) [uncultured marine thaumarchaeote AD1000_96_F07]